MTRVNALLVCLAALLAGLLCEATLATAQDNTREQELNALKGKWVLIRSITDGKDNKVSNNNTYYQFFPQKGEFVFGQGIPIEGGKFTIDPSKRPRWIDFIEGDDVIRSIYKIQGDELWIGHYPDSDERPDTFKGKGVRLEIYKKAAKQ